jgi:hypothetical protein
VLLSQPAPAPPAWARGAFRWLLYWPLLLLARHLALVASILTALLVNGTASALVIVALVAVIFTVIPAPLSGVKRVLLGAAHASLHIFMALSSAVAFEVAVELASRAGLLGADGLHTLFRQYQEQEALMFPDPHDVRGLLARATLGLYPAGIKWAMTVFDVPEYYASFRIALCHACGDLAPFSRLAAAAYYVAFFAYYWVLVTPVCSRVIGLYLYVALNRLSIHWDEGFSSLRITHFKSFLRMRIARNGDLHVFCLGVDRVPKQWVQDQFWWRTVKKKMGLHTEGHDDQEQDWSNLSYGEYRPSRWTPAPGQPDKARIVDYFVIKRAVETATDDSPPEKEAEDTVDWLNLE